MIKLALVICDHLRVQFRLNNSNNCILACIKSNDQEHQHLLEWCNKTPWTQSKHYQTQFMPLFYDLIA